MRGRRGVRRWFERVMLGAVMTVAAWAAEGWLVRTMERREG
jgi:hypothetical protein